MDARPIHASSQRDEYRHTVPEGADSSLKSTANRLFQLLLASVPIAASSYFCYLSVQFFQFFTASFQRSVGGWARVTPAALPLCIFIWVVLPIWRINSNRTQPITTSLMVPSASVVRQIAQSSISHVK